MRWSECLSPNQTKPSYWFLTIPRSINGAKPCKLLAGWKTPCLERPWEDINTLRPHYGFAVTPFLLEYAFISRKGIARGWTGPFKKITEMAAEFIQEFDPPQGLKVKVLFDSYYLCPVVVKPAARSRFGSFPHSRPTAISSGTAGNSRSVPTGLISTNVGVRKSCASKRRMAQLSNTAVLTQAGSRSVRSVNCTSSSHVKTVDERYWARHGWSQAFDGPHDKNVQPPLEYRSFLQGQQATLGAGSISEPLLWGCSYTPALGMLFLCPPDPHRHHWWKCKRTTECQTLQVHSGSPKRSTSHCLGRLSESSKAVFQWNTNYQRAWKVTHCGLKGRPKSQSTWVRSLFVWQYTCFRCQCNIFCRLHFHSCFP